MGLVQDLAGAVLAGAAAGGDAGAGLQLLERVGAVLDGLAEALVGDAVADADVHGLTLGVHPSVTRIVLQLIRI
jgi:hypothetical protein